MPRTDLLALTHDDLASLANRGLVKRAQKEIESGSLTAQWSETDDGTITANWSDGITTTLPGNKTVKDAQCTCGALELCRHILRMVLAWQQRQADLAPEQSVTAAEPWDPGRIPDAAIDAQVTKTVRDRAAFLWSQGVLAELLRSAKPSARFHSPGHTVRFPVPDDLRYAQCSCADPAPCVHAVLAVRAFRHLAAEETSGIISEGTQEISIPEEPIAAAEACIRELIDGGFASLPESWRDRLHRVAADCAEISLIWPAQILEELAEDFNCYIARDAAFTPGPTVGRIGELLLRLDAIRAAQTPIPQAFIRGMKSDRDSDLGASSFVGLGASITETRRNTTTTIYLQDCDNGHVLVLTREFAEDPESTTARKPFHQLARATAVKDASLASLARGQLITQGGRRTAAGKLVIGRARAVVNPQNFSWERLKAPVLVEDFAELRARLKLLPPASFRPRRAGADFHVCPLAGVEHAAFDPETNSIVAILHDASGQQAVLTHPWTERCRTGADALLIALTSNLKPLFVAGHVRNSGNTLHINPTAMVFAAEDGSRSTVVPWIDATSSSAATNSPSRIDWPANNRATRFCYSATGNLASDLILTGLRRTQARQWPGWQQAVNETEERGYHRMATLMRNIQIADDRIASTLTMLKALTLARDIGT